MENTDKQWTDHDVVYASVLKCNNKMVHHSTQMTPNDARKPVSKVDVKTNFELRASHSRKYPEVNVGDLIWQNKWCLFEAN